MKSAAYERNHQVLWFLIQNYSFDEHGCVLSSISNFLCASYVFWFSGHLISNQGAYTLIRPSYNHAQPTFVGDIVLGLSQAMCITLIVKPNAG